MLRTYTATFEVSCPETDLGTGLSEVSDSLPGTVAEFTPEGLYRTAVLSVEYGGPVDYPAVAVADGETAFRGRLVFSVDSVAFDGKGEMKLNLLDEWIESCLELAVSRRFLENRILGFEGR